MSKPRRFVLSLRAWLFVLSLGAMLPALVFGVYAVLDAHQQMRQQVLLDLDAKTRHVARLTNERLDRAVVMLNTLGASHAAQQGNWQELYADANRATENNSWVRAISLVDTQNRLLFLSTVPYGSPLFPTNHPELVNEAVRTGKPNVSGPFTAPVGPNALIAVTLPLVRNGQTTHVLRAIILTDTINHVLDNAGLPLEWVAGIIDREGVLVARTHNPEAFVGQKVPDPLIQDMRRGNTKPTQGLTLDGVPSTRQLRPIFGGDWYVGVAVPTADLNEPLTDAAIKLTLVGLLWTVAAFGLSQWLANHLARQAGELARAVSDAQHTPVATTVAEFNHLMAQVGQVKQHQRETSGRLTHAIEERDEAIDLYNNAPCGYHSVDTQGHIVQINDTELRWLGYNREELMGQPYASLLSPQGRVVFDTCFPRYLAQGHIDDLELEVQHRDGSTRVFLLNATSVRGPQGEHLMSRSTVFDITDRKKLEAQLEQLARFDPLTGLRNRRDFYERAQHELARAKRTHSPLCAMALDLDHFKRINDTHGHAGGDEVLKAFSHLLATALRDIDITARFGGEEFVVLMPNTPLPAALHTAERLRTLLVNTPATLADGTALAYTASIGVSELIDSDSTIDDLLKRADQAVYTAKRAGRNRVST
jgi:diguanylate cyclase (GGDEF)-like protein/PAS domain S-box-containing protein